MQSIYTQNPDHISPIHKNTHTKKSFKRIVYSVFTFRLFRCKYLFAGPPTKLHNLNVNDKPHDSVFDWVAIIIVRGKWVMRHIRVCHHQTHTHTHSSWKYHLINSYMKRAIFAFTISAVLCFVLVGTCFYVLIIFLNAVQMNIFMLSIWRLRFKSKSKYSLYMVTTGKISSANA